jgi:DNA-directed RNA polymerase
MLIQIQKTLPMIYKPLKWKNFNIGSQYLRFTNLARGDSIAGQVENAYNLSNTKKVMNVLDNLGNLKWKVNNKILDVIEYIWASGGNMAKIPKRFNDIILNKSSFNEANSKEKYQMLKLAQENADNHSKRSDFLIKLAIARDFAGINEIYYPHNIDYRGRAYPISPQLNHLGSDLSRGLLEYADSKPLGKNGLRWLKVIKFNQFIT